MKNISEYYKELKKYIDTYLKKYPLPTRNDNHIKFLRLKEIKESSDFDTNIILQKEYKKTRDYIILSNGGFGMKYAIRYYNVLNDEKAILDLFQEANRGIIEATDSFDVTRGLSFTTHAFFSIRKCIIDFIKANKLIKAPRELAKNLKHVMEAQNSNLTRTGKSCTENIQKELQINKGLYLKDDLIDRIVGLIELNSSNNDSFISILTENDLYVVPESDIFRLLRIALEQELDNLSNDVKQLLELRFGINQYTTMLINEIKVILQLDINEFEKLKLKALVEVGV